MLSPNELPLIVQEATEAIRVAVRAALVTVVSISGSAYRRPGARMLVREDGRMFGGVSGGCLEADVVRRARIAMADGAPHVASYDSTDLEDGGFGTGLGCRGVVEILIEPSLLERTMFHLACLRRVIEMREPSVLAVRFRGPSEGLGAIAHYTKVPQGPEPDHPDLQDGVRRVFEQGRWLCMQDLLIEHLPPLPRLLVVGGGPDSEPLVACARTLGYCVLVADERPGQLHRRRFPSGTFMTTTTMKELPDEALDAHTAVVIATHNVAYDERALRRILPSAVRYLGVLGPRQRTVRMLEKLRNDENVRGDWSRVFAPTGLDIGAETPEQIALSVLAEIQAVTSGRSGTSLRDRPSPIHAVRS